MSYKKNSFFLLISIFFHILLTPSSEAQVIPQYPLSYFGGSISSLAGAVNSYNNYLTGGIPLVGPLNDSINTLPVGLTQNQQSVDVAMARVINTSVKTVFYNSLRGTPIYVGQQQQINQLINAIIPTAAAYQDVLNQLSPGNYTTLPIILFNSANIQNTELQERLRAIRFSNNVAESASESTPTDRKKKSNSNATPSLRDDQKQKWTTFIDGNGMWSQAKTVNTLPSYNTYAGGVQTGASYHLIKGLDLGPYVGYQGTRAIYQDAGGSSIVDNSVRYGLFGTYKQSGFYADGIAGGAFNSATVNRRLKFSNPSTDPYGQLGFGPGTSVNSTATGNVSGGEFDSLLGAGYDFSVGDFKIGPAGSVQYSYLGLGSTQESGAGIENLDVGTQNTSSLLTTLGGQVSHDWIFYNKFTLQPYGSLAWQHEFLQNGYNLGSSIMSQNFNYTTTNPGRDQYIAVIGANLLLTKNITFYVACNLINSDSKVVTQSVVGGFNLKF